MIENRLGANALIGTHAVAQASPDGYTLLMGTIATHGVQPSLLANLPYDPAQDFTPEASQHNRHSRAAGRRGYATAGFPEFTRCSDHSLLWKLQHSTATCSTG